VQEDCAARQKKEFCRGKIDPYRCAALALFIANVLGLAKNRMRRYTVPMNERLRRTNMASKSTTAKARKQPTARVAFIESMECLPVATIPEGPEWTYEIKLAGSPYSGIVT
jgi:hypothetical protein